MKEILGRQIECGDTLLLLNNIISSFSSGNISNLLAVPRHSKGLPLGNLTSQLLVNIYMNEFDQYVKQDLREKYYIRYADDFVFLLKSRKHLENLIPQIREFLEDNLHLDLHPKKLFIKTIASGVDFLGWVHFADHRVLRTVTKKRMMRKLKKNSNTETTASYRGLLKHGNTRKIKKELNL